MAYSKVSRQTYFGRVTGPAAKKTIGNKNVLEFSLAIDKAVNVKLGDGNYERQTLFIRCTYAPDTSRGKNPDLDPVVAILTRVSTNDNTDNSLGGAVFKSVEAIVEGVEDFYKDDQGRLFKNLKYCSVQITDNDVLKGYFAFRDAVTGGGANSQGGGQGFQAAPQQAAPQFAPQQAPQFTAPQQSVAPQQAAPAQPVTTTPQGTVQNFGGTWYQLVGTDPSNKESWVPGSVDANGNFTAASSQAALVANSTVNGGQVAAPQAPTPPAPQAPVAPQGNGQVASVKSAFMGGGNGEASFVQAPPAVPSAS